jgi:hypothetical protein
VVARLVPGVLTVASRSRYEGHNLLLVDGHAAILPRISELWSA